MSRVACILAFSVVAPVLGSSGPLPPLPPCFGGITANNFFACRSFGNVKTHLPCGVTNDGLCAVDHSPVFGCDLEIGMECAEDWILFQWETQEDKSVPPSSKCFQLAQAVPSCYREDPADPDCPHEDVSGVCEIGCEPGQFARSSLDQEVEAAWSEPCRAYALMPRGWEDRPFAKAEGFFPVAAHVSQRFTQIGLADLQLLTLRGEMGWKMLATAGGAPLWSDRKNSRIRFDWRGARELGLCWNPQALVGSPHWARADDPATQDRDETVEGVYRRPVVTTCDGTAAWADRTGPVPFDLYRGFDHAFEWEESGALLQDTLPRLRQFADRHGLELVCVTPGVAEKRRGARARALRQAAEIEE